MLTIETIATVTEEGTITAKAPGYLPRGEHRVVIVVDESPLHEPVSRRFPNMAAFRESLELAPYAGNTVLEMREDERS
jgi:hypothetical protein